MPSPAALLGRLVARARMRHLQLLVAVVELESLAKAAASVGMSQPGATHALAELEALIEMPLFERHARGMRPTALGQALVPMARTVLQQLQACAEAVAAVSGGATGTLRIAAIGAAVSGLLAKVLPAFSQEQPHLVVDVLAVGADDLLRVLENRSVELLACREPPTLPPGHRFLPLVDDGYVALCRPAHPLARRRKALSVDELGRWTWLLPPPTGLAGRDFDHLCNALGLVPPICWVSGRSVLLTLAMLQHRDLLAFIPRNTACQLLDDGLLVELALPPALARPMPPVGLVLPDDLARCSEPARRFIERAPALLAARPAAASAPAP